MNEAPHMNPNFPNQRGCFLDKRNAESIKLVDYPTWLAKNGWYVTGEMNRIIPDGQISEKTFASVAEAVEFAKEENYIICTDPWTKPKFEKRKDYQDDAEA